MEEYSSSSNEQDDSDDLDSKKKKKKRAEALGAFVVEPKGKEGASAKSEKSKAEEWWASPAKDEKKPAKAERGNDAKEPDGEVPLEELSPDEVAQVRQQIAETKLVILGSERVDGLSPEDALGDQLVEDFLEQLAYGEQGPDAAMEATLAKIDLKPEDVAEMEPEQEASDEPQEFSEHEAEMFVRDSRPAPRTAPAAEAAADPPPRPPRRAPIAPAVGYNPDFHNAMPRKLRTEYISSLGEPGMLDAALVGGTGGMVGYLIGRRRGRIKTEKKLLPIQKKLEKQVNDLQWELQSRESKLRKVAADRVRAHGPVVIERTLAAAPMPRADQADLQPALNEATARHAAPEAHQLHGDRKASEHLGHMVVIAESRAATTREAAKPAYSAMERPAAAKAPAVKTDKNIETLNRAELLEMSDKIIIDGASLRQIYETRLVGERGLRRLVSEHLRGGNVKRLLRQEVVEREIDFERDPALRDSASQRGTGGGSSQASLKAMLDRVEPGVGADEEATYYKARAAYDTQAQTEQKQKRRVVDVSMGAIIAALVVVVAILLLTH